MVFLICFLAVTGICIMPSIHAAVCPQTSGMSCVQTLFTTSTCNATSNMCQCVYNYVPINSGCAMKPSKPSLRLGDATRINVVVPGQSAMLSCMTTDMMPTGNVSVSYMWMQGTNVFTTPTMNYTIQPANATTVGNFSCMIKFTGVDFTLQSDYSDSLTIYLFNSSSMFTPVVENLPTMAVAGGMLSPTCTGLPFGFTYTFTVGTSSNMMAPFAYSSTQLNITCVVTDILNFTLSPTVKNSALAMLPTLTTGIQNVMLSYSPLMSTTDLTFKNGTQTFIVMCVVPMSMYSSTTTLTYTFTDSNNTSPSVVNGNTYVVPNNAVGVHVITCTATDTSNATNTNTSSTVTVTFTNNYISPLPNLTTNPTTISAGSQLVLICNTTDSTVTSYAWMKDNVEIYRQFDKILQIGSVSASNTGNYVCSARKYNYVVNSNNLYISVKSHGVATLSSAMLVIAAGMLSLMQ
uniref:Ig-like domain-containing protein n=1 Tax=Arion vulgaris TaxID=1028688 RepID=A0A0B7BIN0_9EUPU